ncbi:MAG: alpha/beta fold hydrolase [Oscillospiraceae bacterium]|nr:alpha/beta fold hydrolase [Oscillospiraceae bacterium]
MGPSADGSGEQKLTHEPRFKQGSIDGEIIVFIHGYMGTPRQFDNLADIVCLQGFSYTSLLLPGHGVSVKEFSEATHENWQEHVYNEIERLSLSYKKIWLVGHSMGCLLALHAAIKFPQCVCGVFAIACPLKVTYISAHAFVVHLKKFFGSKNSLINRAYIQFSGVPRTFDLIWRIHKPDFEFLKLQHKTRAILSQVTSPVVGVFSIDDEVTSVKSLDVMQSKLAGADFKPIILQDSLHAYYTERDKTTIEQALLQFIL